MSRDICLLVSKAWQLPCFCMILIVYTICCCAPGSFSKYSKLKVKVPQSRSTALQSHQKKEILETNKNKTNVTYETTDSQKKKKMHERNRLGTVSRKTRCVYVCVCVCGGTERVNQFYSRETSHLILMQLQITNIFSVRIGVLNFICETSQ